jgi:hypothetical protein
MKKLILCSLVLLSGCSLFMANYDTTEYALVNKIRTQSIVGDCTKPVVKELYTTSLEFKNFAEYIPQNKATIDLSDKLHGMVEELYKRENPSPVYCKSKLNTIAKTAEEIQRVVGSKPR